MHFYGIQNDSELQRKMKMLSLKHAFWRYWKWFWTAAKIIKTKLVYCALWRYFKRFGNAEKNENRDDKWWILTVFETIWNCREKMKTRTFERVFCHYLKRYFGTAKKIWKQGQYMLHYAAIWYALLTCKENCESNEAQWCILTVFETCARRLLGGSAIANVNQASETDASETNAYTYGGTCKS